MILDIWHRIGRRGATLLMFALVDFTMGYNMLTVPKEIVDRSYIGHTTMLPLEVWACLWIATACVLVVHAFRIDDRIGFAAAMGIKLLWAIGFCVSLFVFQSPRALIGLVLWVVIAGWLFLVAGWPEAQEAPRALE